MTCLEKNQLHRTSFLSSQPQQYNANSRQSAQLHGCLQTHRIINRVYQTRKYILAGCITLLFLTAGLGSAKSASHELTDVSAKNTFEIYRSRGCLTEDQIDFGREIIRGLNYNAQRAFRRICLLPGIDFASSRKSWSVLLETPLSFEQVLAFEEWSDLEGVDIPLALQALPEIATLNYEAGRAFRSYLTLPGISPKYSLKTIPLLNGLKDAKNRAVQGFMSIHDMDAVKALDGMITLARLVDHQARAADSYARITDMNTETMLDTLPLLRQLRQEDAWNAHNLFKQPGMTRVDGWLWIIRYFALPPLVQEAQYYRQDDDHKKALLQAFYNGGEELIWKINNLHAITDRFGFEVSRAQLGRQTKQQLYARFKKLSNQTRFTYGKKFYPAWTANNRTAMITVLRKATAADRVQTARDLSSANIYALLSQGSELYDSSFRDILVPILKKRIATNHNGDLLTFIRAIDPDNMLVSSFIVSLAQKGKLTTFFPDDEDSQKQILNLVAASAFANEDSILLFSATFIHLLKVLQPEARTYLIDRMSREADNNTSTFSRLISVILQYYMQEYPELLSTPDRVLITRLIIRRGAIDLSTYQQAPFADWKEDGRLASVSVFHPDDDGRKSFYSNVRTLQRSGYQLDLSRQYTLAPLSSDGNREINRLITEARKNPEKGLPRLFSAMGRNHFAVALSKQINGLTIRHAQYVYSDEKNQQLLLERFLKGGDEMFAQRGHSYWRSEQITEPLIKSIREQTVTTADIDAKQRFLSLGSCGGVKAYTRLTRLFRGKIDILATIGTGMAIINDPYNKNFFEVIAANPDTISWQTIAEQSAFIFQGGRGQDYLQPGSLTAILHKIIDENKKAEELDRAHENMIQEALCPEGS